MFVYYWFNYILIDLSFHLLSWTHTQIHTDPNGGIVVLYVFRLKCCVWRKLSQQEHTGTSPEDAALLSRLSWVSLRQAPPSSSLPLKFFLSPSPSGQKNSLSLCIVSHIPPSVRHHRLHSSYSLPLPCYDRSWRRIQKVGDSYSRYVGFRFHLMKYALWYTFILVSFWT